MSKNKKITLKEVFNLALDNHQKKKIQIAESLYKKILSVDPNNIDTHNNLGVLFKEIGKYQNALTHFKNVYFLGKKN